MSRPRAALTEFDGSGGSSLDPRLLLQALQRVSSGDFSVRLPGDWTGVEGKIADTFNQIVAANEQMAHELKRVGEVVGKAFKTKIETLLDDPAIAVALRGGS